ncbi:MAG: BrnT family toxin [Nevskiales bacterium]
MEYEWDEAKREANLDKHGLDFILAPLIYEADFKLTLPSPRGNETRWVDIAELEDESVVVTMVYALRGEVIRVISLRRANSKEHRIYVKAKDQSLQQ